MALPLFPTTSWNVVVSPAFDNVRGELRLRIGAVGDR
jgi:hypothetical protein